MVLEPMLVAAGPVPALTDRWVVEPKLDGWRVLVHVDSRGVRVRSRNGADITERVPELCGLADVVPAGTVLNGELIAGQGDAESFYRILARVAVRPPGVVNRAYARTPLTFAAFDVPVLAGRDLCGHPLDQRRACLDDLGLDAPAWTTVRRLDVVDLDQALAACERVGFEGFVLKRRRSSYRPGERRPWWVKVKTPTWKELHHPRRGEHESLSSPPGQSGRRSAGL